MSQHKIKKCEEGYSIYGHIFKEEKDAKDYLDFINTSPRLKKELEEQMEGKERKVGTFKKLILLMAPKEEDKKREVAVDKKFHLLLISFIAANIITGILIVGPVDFPEKLGSLVRNTLFFPVGICFFLLPLNPLFGLFIGWGFYATFFFIIMFSSNKVRFKKLFYVWICVLVLNIGGCTFIVRGFSL